MLLLGTWGHSNLGSPRGEWRCWRLRGQGATRQSPTQSLWEGLGFRCPPGRLRTPGWSSSPTGWSKACSALSRHTVRGENRPKMLGSAPGPLAFPMPRSGSPSLSRPSRFQGAGGLAGIPESTTLNVEPTSTSYHLTNMLDIPATDFPVVFPFPRRQAPESGAFRL